MKNMVLEWIECLMHSLPGMPPHAEAVRWNSNAHGRRLASHVHEHAANPVNWRQPLQDINAHSIHRQPRVLVAWQEWTGRNLARQKDQA